MLTVLLLISSDTFHCYSCPLTCLIVVIGPPLPVETERASSGKVSVNICDLWSEARREECLIGTKPGHLLVVE